MIANYKQYYEIPKSVHHIIKENFDTNDIVTLIKRVDKDSAEKRYSKRFAKFLKGKTVLETCKNIFHFVKTNILYIGDPKGYEQVKSPHQVILDGFADCKGMSGLVMDLLRELGIDADFKFVAWKITEDVQHVYVVTNEGIIIDCVHTRFNEEVKPFYNVKIVKMSKLVWIKGLETESHLESHLFSRKPFFNYHSMTEGELYLHIQMEKLKLAETVYPDSRNVSLYRKNIELINNTIYKGVHGVRGNAWTPSNDTVSIAVKNAIAYAQKNFTSAAGIIDYSRRRNPTGNGISGIDPMIQTLDLNIDFESCLRESDYNPITGENSQWIDTVCNKQQEFKKVINERWEAGSHHFLYEFIKNPNIYPNTVSTKAVLQKMVIPETARVSSLSNTNLKEWASLGVSRANAAKSIGLLSPEDTIIQLYRDRDKNEKGEHIGDFGATMLILLIIAVATPALAGLVQVFKGQEPTAFQSMNEALRIGVTGSNMDFNNGKKGKASDYLNIDNKNYGDGHTDEDDDSLGLEDEDNGNSGNQGGNGGKNPPITNPKPNSFLDGMTTGEKVGAGLLGAAAIYYGFIKD